jgi:hypothetical protein
MPSSYTARDADQAVRRFLADEGCEPSGIATWPLAEWLADGPGRFIHLGERYAETGWPDCAVEFHAQHASVSLPDVGSGDVAWTS